MRGSTPDKKSLIIIHFPQTVKQYATAPICPGREIEVPEQCPSCQAIGELIRWGYYRRQVKTGVVIRPILVQRVRCKGCEVTHGLLPDFVHPYRHYALVLMQQVIWLHLFLGLSGERLLAKLGLSAGPEVETLRAWLSSYGYGAGYLLWGALQRFVGRHFPDSPLLPGRAPPHLNRRKEANHQQKGYHYWQLAEILYARLKQIAPQMTFEAGQLLVFMLHWQQSVGLVPRIFWSPRLKTTPTAPF